MSASRVAQLAVSVRPASAALLVVLLAAFGLRVYGLDWDRGHYLHPDERYVVDSILIGRISFAWPPDLDVLFDPAISTLNPRSADPNNGELREFPYGALPVLVTDLAAEVVGWFTNTNWHEYGNAYKVGRFLSALFDTLTVWLVYLIGLRLGGRRVALLAALVAALTPLTIQLAHFFTTDSWLTTFVALSLYCAIRAAEEGTVRWFAATGAAFGLAMATKGSVFTLGGIVALAILYDLWRRWQEGESPLAALTAAPERIAVAGFAALGAFALFEPYALLQPDIYRTSFETQARIVQGTFDVPFTRQYIGTTPVLYQLEQLVRFGMGPVAGLTALAGVPLLIWRLVRRRGAAELIVLAWLLGYGLVISLPEAKFMRYLAPLIPVFALAAGLALDALWRFLAARINRSVALGAVATALAGMLLWTSAFESIYARENTRLAASAWIFANVPSGSVLSNEYWDDALPKGLGPGLTSEDRQFGSVTFDLYGDKIAWSDLAAYGDRLLNGSLTRPVGEALQEGDVRTAADRLRDLGAVAPSLPEEGRLELATILDSARAQLGGPAHELGNATARAAVALREDPEALGGVFASLADALVAAGENEAGNYIYGLLEQIDYYVISSNRVVSSLPHSPWRYPVPVRFYELLQNGQLGFELAAEFRHYPRLGPIELDDDAADESWLNYDHPHVWIYKKVELAPKTDYDRLMAAARAQDVNPTRYQSDDLMLDEPVGELPVVADARWSEALTGNSWGAMLVWLALLVALQVAGWPWARLVFARFPDGGWTFARLLALLVAGFVVWLGASLELIAFRAVWCGLALAIFAAAGWTIHTLWRDRPGGRGLTGAQRRVALTGELAFVAVFALFLLFRYLNPDSWHPYWGGEKPMEFAHLNATLRSAHFPPYDPWFAGGHINYYYYGFFLVAFCLKLTGIPSEIGFNLAQPTIMALFAAAGFGAAAALGRDLLGRVRHRRTAFGGIAAGLLGVLLLIGIGNLDAFLRWLDDRQASGFGYWTWDPSRAIDGAITEFPYFTGLYADLHAHVVSMPITVLVIALGYSLAVEPRRVALAALRPRRHPGAALVVAARFGLLALACGTLFVTNAWDVATYLALGGAALYLATAGIRPVSTRLLTWIAGCGALGALAYGLFLPFHLHYVALFSSVARTRQPTEFWQFADHLGGLLAIACLGLITLLLARAGGSPPLLGQPIVPVALIGLIVSARAVLPADAADLRGALTAALAMVPAITLLAAGWHAAERVAFPAAVEETGPLLLRCALALVAGIALVAAATDRTVLGLMLVVAASGGMLWLCAPSSAERYLALMVAGGAAIVAGLEVVFLADNLRGSDWERMNSIFKFYNQIWTLLALAGAALIVRMTVEAWPGLARASARWQEGRTVLGIADQPLPAPASRSHESRDHAAESDVEVEREIEREMGEPAAARWARTGLIVAALVVGLSLFYPVLATKPRLEQRFTSDLGSGTLNALDWMDYGTITTSNGDSLTFADDRAGIEWFWNNVDGSPVIVEASIGPYRCNGSRYSIATGLPALIGWENHLTQQRFPDGLDERSEDVALLYASPDTQTKLAILRRYDVEYVVVGPLERMGIKISGNDCVPTDVAAGIAAFDGMVGTSLEVVFQQGETTIYLVIDQPADDATGEAPA